MMTPRRNICRMRAILMGTMFVALAQASIGVEAGPRAAEDEAWQRTLEGIDTIAAGIADLTATFEERKYTALLRKPLVSTGLVRIRGRLIRWDTQKPHRSVTFLDGRRISIYYPRRATVEIYEIEDRLTQLAISPIPRPSVLREHFSLERLDTPQSGEHFDPRKHIAIRLRPKSESLAEYVQRMDIVLDRQTACVLSVEMTDADGERTVLTFRDVKINTGLEVEDVQLTVPEGTRRVRPLEPSNKEDDGR